MIKKYIWIAVIVSIATLAIGIWVNKENEEKNLDTKYKEENLNINPISKENALMILKSEYGEHISNTIDDIELIDEEYVIDVCIDLEHGEEGFDSHEEVIPHSHKESIGIHKINIYTGKLIKPE